MSRSKIDVVVALQDMGCIQNALPVAKQLKQEGYRVSLLLNAEKGVAKGKISSGEIDIGSLPIVDTVNEGDILLTCLPTWILDQKLIPASAQVVLIPENGLVTDDRFQKWIHHSHLTIVGIPMFGYDVCVTGLPAVESASRAIASCNVNSVIDGDKTGNLSITTDAGHTILSVAMPGDLDTCKRIIKTLQLATQQRADLYVFARTHPKLPKEDLSEIAKDIKGLGGYSLPAANANFGPTEQMALGKLGLFICDWNSTMALQASAAGVPVGLIPPASKDPVQWIHETALLQNANAIPFLGAHPFWNNSVVSRLQTNPDATNAIAMIVKDLAHT